MFCYQCQEAAKGTGCTIRGVCGKGPETADLQDRLVAALKDLAGVARQAEALGADLAAEGLFVAKGLFATITNANFDDARFEELLAQAGRLTAQLATRYGLAVSQGPFGVLSTDNEDVRSLRELVIYGLKGVAAYAEHAAMLGKEDPKVYSFFMKALASTNDDLSVDQLVALVLETGSIAVTTMALLDAANTGAYGHPEMTKVDIGVGSRPGILVSGHDLKDFEELLIATRDQGIDIYTHSEMLPANYYPAFKKFSHFHGNYGSSWWHQAEEFEAFRGPILMTTNCIVPPKDSYKAKMYTTGMAGYPGCPHIADRTAGGKKDYSALIAEAKRSQSPVELETGTIVGGFAHHQVFALADKVVEAVKSGAIKKFVVMAGCDGRQKQRSYFTEVAEALPATSVILTAGCAKYRYNKLNLGDIGGIPRVLDAGQCNDSYSLAVIALKLKEIFGAADVNDLPIAFDIAWYEQKAVAVLLALLALGFKSIRLGPTLPAFLSPNVVDVLVRNFGIMGTTTVEADVALIMA
jgi:hydroxylamine reductase